MKNSVVSKTAGNVPNQDFSLAFPAGHQDQTWEAPDVNMKTNDGDNPKVADAPFADGSDVRGTNQRGPKSNPYPAMPGANN